jgi:hypothetical protein
MTVGGFEIINNNNKALPKEVSRLVELPDGGVEWQLRDAKMKRYDCDSTVILRVPAAKFDKKVTLRMEWYTVPSNDTWKTDPEGKASKGGKVEVGDNLRCVAGTSDFRVGLFQTAEKMSRWKGWQVRYHPHLAAWWGKHVGADDLSNASHWHRAPPSKKEGLLDDWAQSGEYGKDGTGDHSAFVKVGKFGFGAAAPVEGWYAVEITLERDGGGTISPSLRVHESTYDAKVMKTFKFANKATPDYIDAIAVSFNNTSRPYAALRIRNVTVVSGDAKPVKPADPPAKPPVKPTVKPVSADEALRALKKQRIDASPCPCGGLKNFVVAK